MRYLCAYFIYFYIFSYKLLRSLSDRFLGAWTSGGRVGIAWAASAASPAVYSTAWRRVGAPGLTMALLRVGVTMALLRAGEQWWSRTRCPIGFEPNIPKCRPQKYTNVDSEITRLDPQGSSPPLGAS